jgi:hypothetical protein
MNNEYRKNAEWAPNAKRQRQCENGRVTQSANGTERAGGYDRGLPAPRGASCHGVGFSAACPQGLPLLLSFVLFVFNVLKAATFFVSPTGKRGVQRTEKTEMTGKAIKRGHRGRTPESHTNNPAASSAGNQAPCSSSPSW